MLNNSVKITDHNSFLTGIVVVEILLLSFFLRFWDLDINPHWYVDEGAYTDVARNLSMGVLRNEAMSCNFFQRSLPHPPLMFILAALLMRVFGSSIVVIRAITAGSGLITTLFMYFTGKELIDKKVGLLAAFLFAIHPLTVIFNRWGFEYNIGMFFTLITFYFTIIYFKTKKPAWVYSAAIAAGLCMITTYQGITLLLFVVIAVFTVDRKKIISVGLAGLSFTLIFIVIMLSIFGFQFFSDMYNVFTGIGGQDPGKLSLIPATYLSLMSTDYFILFGIIGLFLFRFRYREWLIAVFFLTSILIVKQSGPPINEFFYRAVFFMPFVLLGTAVFVNGLPEKLFDFGSNIYKLFVNKKNETVNTALPGGFYRSIVFSIIAITLFLVVIRDVRGALNGYKTKMDLWAVESIEDTRLTAMFINDSTDKNDFVIAPRYFYWLLECRYTDFLQPVAYSGRATTFYPEKTDKNRFYFDCSYNRAKYVVISNNLNRWAIFQPGVQQMMDKICEEKWTGVFSRGEYSVLQNPHTETTTSGK